MSVYRTKELQCLDCGEVINLGRVTNPPDDEEDYNTHANFDSSSDIEDLLAFLDAHEKHTLKWITMNKHIKPCPICGESVSVIGDEERGFYLSCDKCPLVYGLRLLEDDFVNEEQPGEFMDENILISRWNDGLQKLISYAGVATFDKT